MNIVRLTISNFKRIVAVEVSPDGSLVILGGNNGSGKSSLLDGIMAALAGGRAIPDQPIHTGAGKAEIQLDLGEVIVTRTISPKGATLKIKTKEGATYPRAQAWLDERLSNLSCDPLAFLREKVSDQASRLRQIVGVDTAALDKARAITFEERRDIGRDRDKEKGALSRMPLYPGLPEEEVQPETVSVTELLAQLQEAGDTNRAADAAKLRAGDAATAAILAEDTVVRLRSALHDAERALVAARIARDEAAAIAGEAVRVDEADLRVALDSLEDRNEGARTAAEEVNVKVRANQAHARQAGVLEAAEEMYADLTRDIEKIDADRKALLAAADFPIEGLSFSSDGTVTYKDFPFSQASQAEQIRVSVAVALAGNPEIRIILIRDGSLLDDSSLALVRDLAEEHGAQVWLERVGDRDNDAVVIEDGRVRGEG